MDQHFAKRESSANSNFWNIQRERERGRDRQTRNAENSVERERETKKKEEKRDRVDIYSMFFNAANTASLLKKLSNTNLWFEII